MMLKVLRGVRAGWYRVVKSVEQMWTANGERGSRRVKVAQDR